MNDFLLFLQSFSMTPLYDAGVSLATITTLIAGLLLPVAALMRLAGGMLDTLKTSQSTLHVIVIDVVIWATVLGSYLLIAAVIGKLFSVFYAYVDQLGSVQAISMQLDAIMTQINESMEQERAWFDVLGKARDAGASAWNPLAWLPMLVYYGLLFLLIGLMLVLRFAHAACFAIFFAAGPILIALAVTNRAKTLKSWWSTVLIILCWPIVEGALMALLSIVLISPTEALVGADTAFLSNKTIVYIAFSLVNVVAIATLVAAPILTVTLLGKGTLTEPMKAFSNTFLRTAGAAMQGAVSSSSWAKSMTGKAGDTLSTLGSTYNPSGNFNQWFDNLRDAAPIPDPSAALPGGTPSSQGYTGPIHASGPVAEPKTAPNTTESPRTHQMRPESRDASNAGTSTSAQHASRHSTATAQQTTPQTESKQASSVSSGVASQGSATPTEQPKPSRHSQMSPEQQQAQKAAMIQRASQSAPSPRPSPSKGS